MPCITLSRHQVKQLADFCAEHKRDKYFIAKDHGAYIGASMGPDTKCIFYFAGCDPQKNPDYYDKASAAFGGDDFGEFLEVAGLNKLLANERVGKVKFTVTKRSIKIEAYS